MKTEVAAAEVVKPVGRKGSDEMSDLAQCLDDHMMSAVEAMLDLQVAVRRASRGDAAALEAAEREAEMAMCDYAIIRRRVCGLVKERVNR